MKIALLGFGTVGGGVYELLRGRPEAQIKYILCRRELTVPGAAVIHDYRAALDDPEIDTVVELLGGEHPAYEAVRDALGSRRSVVSANKAMLSRHYRELASLAQARGAPLRFSAAVGGGIPWLASLGHAVDIEEVVAISGIVNGTTNFMLDAMATRGLSYRLALAEAQRLGYAEADPAADVDGWDAQQKLILSCNVAFGVSLDGASVPAFGIRGITAGDIAAFRRMGLVCRLMVHARRTAQGISAYVEPTLVPESSLLAGVRRNNNLITLESRCIGAQSFYGQGAGRYPTAYNVVQDILAVGGGYGFRFPALSPVSADNRAVLHRYYADGCITEPLSVGQMHKNSGLRFFAALSQPGEAREEEA